MTDLITPEDAIAELARLRAERDAAVELAEKLLQGQHRLSNQLNDTARDLNAELSAANAREAGLREALTPSGDTKAAYMGEVKDPETKRMVSWTAIKMVMAMIAARTAQPSTEVATKSVLCNKNGREGDQT